MANEENGQMKPPVLPKISDKKYKKTLYDLQVELVKFQRHLIRKGERVLIVFEGRDAAGKDGTIKRITEHMSPRETRVVALGKPSDRDRTSWYFQRYAAHLPAGEELVIFNRSWYNRAGVEPVMGFCTEDQHQEFLAAAPAFESMLAKSGIKLFKYYLDINRDEQKERLQARRDDPLKQWKISKIDEVAIKKWKAYSQCRNEMFARTHHANGQWTIVRADIKRVARLNVIKHFLGRMSYQGKDKALCLPDPNVVFTYAQAHHETGMIAE
jgi:polyphosphate kinase 2